MIQGRDSDLATTNPPPHLHYADSPLFSYAKNQKNIVVIVLDMFSGSHTPYILEQFPEFKTQLDGFTLYPNAISTTNSTVHSIATLIGGEYYSAYNMNKRDLPLLSQIKDAYLSTGLAFADSGYNVSFMDDTFGRDFLTHNKIFVLDDIYSPFQPFLIKSYNLEAQFESYKAKTKHYETLNLLNFGLFRFAPEWSFRERIYNEGDWLYQKDYNVLNSIYAIDYAASAYAPTHIVNVESKKPTFKFFHTMMTHLPYSAYFNGKECEFFSDKSAWNDYPHKVKMFYPNKWREKGFYQHFDTEACALKFVGDYVELLKNAGIYDNTQIFIVSDHSGNDNINIPILDKDDSRPDSLLLFKDFGAKGALRIDSRLMANYDIVSIFCANLKGGCPNVPKNILQHYPTNREIIHTIPMTWILEKHKPNKWLINKAYKVRQNIYDKQNWSDISDESHGIVNHK